MGEVAGHPLMPCERLSVTPTSNDIYYKNTLMILIPQDDRDMIGRLEKSVVEMGRIAD